MHWVKTNEHQNKQNHMNKTQSKEELPWSSSPEEGNYMLLNVRRMSSPRMFQPHTNNEPLETYRGRSSLPYQDSHHYRVFVC